MISLADVAAEAEESVKGPDAGQSGRVSKRRIVLWSLPASLLALGMTFYICTLPNILYGEHEYDDGVYLGAAMRLVHGIAPYRNFVIVHPPGIVLLMTPIAALSGWIGTDACMALARDLTFLVGGVNPLLAALVVRHRGRTAAVVAATSLAIFPMAIAADQSLLLEPYLMFFCLIGLILMFSEGRLASPRRVMLGGIFLGLGASVKIWGLFVIAAAALICLRHVRKALLPVLAGSAIGFGVPCLPFFLMAPTAFIRDIFGDQFERVVTGSATFSSGERMIWLTGLEGLTIIKATDGLAVVAVIAFVAFVGSGLIVGRRSLRSLDWMIVAASTASVAVMWAPNYLLPHYTYFPATFLSLLLGVSVAIHLDRLRLRYRSVSRRSWIAVCAAGCVIAAAFLVPQQAGYARSNLAVAKNMSFLNLFMSSQSCIVSDDAALTIEAGVFAPAHPNCPDLVDSYGTWLAQGPGTDPGYGGNGQSVVNGFEGPYPAAFENEWAKWLSEGDFVLMLQRWSPYIPWTPQLKAWFSSNFHLITGASGLWIYRHVDRTPPPFVTTRST
jgi:hypothetical protein